MAPLGGLQPAFQPGQFIGWDLLLWKAFQSPLILLGQILVDILGLNALELTAGQDAQQLPAQVQGLLNGAVLLGTLGDIALFKLVGKLGVE